MDTQFFQTPMGRSFYDGSVAPLVKALERIADALQVPLPRRSNTRQSVKAPAKSAANHTRSVNRKSGSRLRQSDPILFDA